MTTYVDELRNEFVQSTAFHSISLIYEHAKEQKRTKDFNEGSSKHVLEDLRGQINGYLEVLNREQAPIVEVP